MTANRFNELDIDQKAEYCWKNAKFINSIIYYNHRVLLYISDELYIEIFYSLESKKIEQIELNNNPDRLLLYAESVDLSNLMK